MALSKIDTHIHGCLVKTPRENPWRPEAAYTADWRELKDHLQSQGIGKAILMSSGEQPSEGFPGSCNAECMEIAGYDQFFAWMCNVDPVSPQTVRDRLAACKAQGAVGVGELMVNQWLDSPFLTSVFEAAQELELPVTIHMSPEPGVSYGVCDRPGLPLLEGVLQRFPKLKLVGHSQVFWAEISADCPADVQGRNGFGQGPVLPGGRIEKLMDAYPNLYADLSAYSASCAIMRDEAYGLAFLKKYASRLFFATDTTNRYDVFPLGQFLDAAVTDGRLPQEVWEAICVKNAKRVYGL